MSAAGRVTQTDIKPGKHMEYIVHGSKNQNDSKLTSDRVFRNE